MVKKKRTLKSLRAGWSSRAAIELRKNATKAERVFRIKLLDAGFLKHRFQKIFKNDDHIFIADFFLSKYRIAIEIDGGYHFTQTQIMKDAERERIIMSFREVRGILRLTNEQAISIDPARLHEIITGMNKNECLCLY